MLSSTHSHKHADKSSDEGHNALSSEDKDNMLVHTHLNVRHFESDVGRVKHYFSLMACISYQSNHILRVPERGTSEQEIIRSKWNHILVEK